MNSTYEVSEQKQNGQTVTVDAKDQFSAVKKAHEAITGKKTTAKVLWHGVHAEIEGCKYNVPVLVWRKN
jgi:hypothetical protein